jgi:hypothetical protein
MCGGLSLHIRPRLQRCPTTYIWGPCSSAMVSREVDPLRMAKGGRQGLEVVYVLLPAWACSMLATVVGEKVSQPLPSLCSSHTASRSRLPLSPRAHQIAWPCTSKPKGENVFPAQK